MILEVQIQKNLPLGIHSSATLQTKTGNKIEGTVIEHGVASGIVQVDFPDLTQEMLLEDVHVFFGKKTWSNPESITYKNELTEEQEKNLLCTTEEVKWDYTNIVAKSLKELTDDSKQLGEKGWEMINWILIENDFLAMFKKSIYEET